MLHWIAHFFGFANGDGNYPGYLFWSGFGSDIGEVTVLGAAISLIRHQNCHAKGCWKLGHPLEGTAYRVCHKHNPKHSGEKRNVAVDEIHAAHRGE